jgi:predicted glycoside hydrolase/deacetylase ChbG (UPF0249 family)
VKRLIINADDFGLAPGVNRAVVELQHAGVLTSATLMATGAYFSPAVYLAFAQPRLGVGCHITLVDGLPVLRTVEVPSLLERGRLRTSVGAFLRDLMRGRIREGEIEAEATAQIQRIQSSGITVSHIDSHKHLHAFPGVLRPLLRAARECQVHCIRNPFEPLWSLRATRGGGLRRAQVHLMRSQRRAFLKLTAEHGMLTTDGAIGVLATGRLDDVILAKLLSAVPAGTWELVCHPGYRDRALEEAHTRLLTSRDVERTALLETVPAARPGFDLIDFHQLG